MEGTPHMHWDRLFPTAEAADHIVGRVCRQLRQPANEFAWKIHGA
jgi:hypothetical protein